MHDWRPNRVALVERGQVRGFGLKIKMEVLERKITGQRVAYLFGFWYTFC